MYGRTAIVSLWLSVCLATSHCVQISSLHLHCHHQNLRTTKRLLHSPLFSFLYFILYDIITLNRYVNLSDFSLFDFLCSLSYWLFFSIFWLVKCEISCLVDFKYCFGLRSALICMSQIERRAGSSTVRNNNRFWSSSLWLCLIALDHVIRWTFLVRRLCKRLER